MRIAIFDDGAGNVHSLEKVLAPCGQVVHQSDVRALVSADLVVLPGVGAFDPGMARFGDQSPLLRDALRDGVACLAICLGMQMLFESSEEGTSGGIGLLEGTVTRMKLDRLPHIGWTRVVDRGEATLAASGLNYGYYAHSYACPDSGAHAVTSTSLVEGHEIPATIRMGRVLGCQFHPEKSSSPGVAMVRAFVEEVTT